MFLERERLLPLPLFKLADALARTHGLGLATLGEPVLPRAPERLRLGLKLGQGQTLQREVFAQGHAGICFMIGWDRSISSQPISPLA